LIDFSISTGKIVPEQINLFYFAAFKGDKRIFKT